MLSIISNHKYCVRIIALHVLLGAIFSFQNLACVIWFFFSVAGYTIELLRNNVRVDKRTLTLQAMCYLVSFEVIARMSGAAPLIPTEIGKYLMLLFFLSGFLVRGKLTYMSLIMIILLLPGFFHDKSSTINSYHAYVYNGLGAVIMAVGIALYSRTRISIDNFQKILLLLLFPILSVATFVATRLISINEITFQLGANFDTSGGFGSNQVSTVLGFGLLITFIFLRRGWILSGKPWLDRLIFIVLLIEGLLTFSRGGVLGALVGILFLIFDPLDLVRHGRNKRKTKRSFRNLAGLLVLVLIFTFANSFTDGLLMKRFSGQTSATVRGDKEVSLNTLTTGRFDLLLGDLDLFSRHPLFGVGVGASPALRATLKGVAPHIEFSRLAAEHGSLGVIFFVLLLLTAVKKIKSANRSDNTIMLSLFFLALFTTFHSATRTYVSILPMVLSQLIIVRSDI